MTMGHFAKHRQPPSPEEIQSALGERYPLWLRLTGFIEANYQVAGEWSTWGPKGFGWGQRYRRKGRALAALYPQKGLIIVQVVLGKAQAGRALALDLGEKVGEVMREAPQLRDGRWLSIPVLDESDAADVERLLLAKAEPGRR
jgi:hypothetical protein